MPHVLIIIANIPPVILWLRFGSPFEDVPRIVFAPAWIFATAVLLGIATAYSMHIVLWAMLIAPCLMMVPVGRFLYATRARALRRAQKERLLGELFSDWFSSLEAQLKKDSAEFRELLKASSDLFPLTGEEEDRDGKRFGNEPPKPQRVLSERPPQLPVTDRKVKQLYALYHASLLQMQAEGSALWEKAEHYISPSFIQEPDFAAVRRALIRAVHHDLGDSRFSPEERQQLCQAILPLIKSIQSLAPKGQRA